MCDVIDSRCGVYEAKLADTQPACWMNWPSKRALRAVMLWRAIRADGVSV